MDSDDEYDQVRKHSRNKFRNERDEYQSHDYKRSHSHKSSRHDYDHYPSSSHRTRFPQHLFLFFPKIKINQNFLIVFQGQIQWTKLFFTLRLIAHPTSILFKPPLSLLPRRVPVQQPAQTLCLLRLRPLLQKTQARLVLFLFYFFSFAHCQF